MLILCYSKDWYFKALEEQKLFMYLLQLSFVITLKMGYPVLLTTDFLCALVNIWRVSNLEGFNAIDSLIEEKNAPGETGR